MAKVASFLRVPVYMAVTLLLAIEAIAYYTYPTQENVPLSQPLKSVPLSVGQWRMQSESELETEVQDLLRADETLNRTYAGTNDTVGLFVAFFKSQRTGVAPHSPKVCLPGSGWTPSESARINIKIPGTQDPILVNRYLVSKGENHSVVYYWYQTPFRAIASEYVAKLYTIVDGVRYHRSDTSLIRVIVPVAQADKGIEAADQVAVNFIQDFTPVLRNYLPQR